uniref:Uncharacterized protein n=1 Tax=Panagrolaimus superbus TaxID=310955 RepID=A0A914Z2I4_9BILA
MDSNIFALILQKEDGYRRLIKPKNGNWREPKEKWDFFKVYAALKQQPEHTSNTLNENLNSTAKAAFNLNKNIKAEIPTMSVIVPQDNAELQQPNTLSSVPNSENRINNSKIKAETSTVLDTIQQKVPEPHHSSESAMHDDESETEIEVSATNDMTSTDGYDSVTDDKGSASRITTIDSPNDAQIFSAYKVSSFEELRYMLCRGDTKMKKKFFEQTVKLFKRTIIAYPNNEIIRLIYWLRKCEMKNLDLYTQEYCKVCENGSKMSVGHLFSLQHLKAV